MAAVPQPRPQAEELSELQVRVVHLNELGAKVARAAPEELKSPAQPPARRTPAAPPAPPQQRQSATPAQQRLPATPPQQRQPAARPSPQPSQAPRPPPAAPRTDPQARAPVAKPAAPATSAEPQRKALLTSGRLFFVLTCVVLYYGWSTQTERYITPKRGIGYALGIIGGSLMLLLLVYSLRKRWHWLRFLGSTPSWFRFHMVLGILGPVCILYHSNFMTGATNSNVALFAMLTVAGSGLAGRYIYAHIHHGLYGHKLQLGELRAGAEGLRNASGGISFLPELVTRLESAEQRVLRAGPRLSILGFAKPMVVSVAALRARWQLHRYVRHSLHASARRSAVVAVEQKRLRLSAHAYVDKRLAATRRVASFEGFERLFSLWHALHIPLIFMMIIAAVIHVIAVHVY